MGQSSSSTNTRNWEVLSTFWNRLTSSANDDVSALQVLMEVVKDGKSQSIFNQASAGAAGGNGMHSVARFLCVDILENPSTSLDRKRETLKTIAFLVSHIPEFGVVVMQSDPAMTSKLGNFLQEQHEQTLRGMAALTIANLAFKVPEFGQHVVNEDPNLGAKLCDLLSAPNDATKCYAQMAISHLALCVEDFGSNLISTTDPNLGSELCKFLCSPRPSVQYSAVMAIGCLVEKVPWFGPQIAQMDSNLGYKISTLLIHGNDIAKCNASMAIASLVEKVPAFGETLIWCSSAANNTPTTSCAHASKHIELHLCNLLVNPDDKTKSNAAWAIATLVDRLPNFARSVASVDSTLGSKLCYILLKNSSVAIRANAAIAIGSLIENVHSFRDSIPASDMDIASALVQLLVNVHCDAFVKTRAAQAIGKIVSKVARFGQYVMAVSDGLIGPKLCVLLQVKLKHLEDELVMKQRIMETVVNMLYHVECFERTIVNYQHHQVSFASIICEIITAGTEQEQEAANGHHHHHQQCHQQHHQIQVYAAMVIAHILTDREKNREVFGKKLLETNGSLLKILGCMQLQQGNVDWAERALYGLSSI